MRRVVLGLSLLAPSLLVRAAPAAPREAKAEPPAATTAPVDAPVRKEEMPLRRRQLLLVRSASFEAVRAHLRRYEREADQAWRPVGEAVDVNVGRRGMAWGRGTFDVPSVGPQKREGDGKSPAGSFPLQGAFGRAPSLPEGAGDYPYLTATSTSYCVEDTRSPHYNELVDSAELEKGSWQRWSPLRRRDALFDWAIVVGQNPAPARVGAGSCVFLHVWRGPGQGTSGCTAMQKTDIEDILRWLDVRAEPRLVQLPDPAYDGLIEAWDLPP